MGISTVHATAIEHGSGEERRKGVKPSSRGVITKNAVVGRVLTQQNVNCSQLYSFNMVNIINIINQQMLSQKIIICHNFHDGIYDTINGDYRATIPVFNQSGNSFQLPLELLIVCPSGSPEFSFHLSLLVITGRKKSDKKCIYRMDYGEREEHRFNPSHPPPHGWNWHMFLKMKILGSHIHTWELNKHLSKGRRLPRTLPYALPIKAQGWDAAFDAFCQATLIKYDTRPHCRRGLL